MSAQESDLYELSMSEESQPLMAAVKKHIEENVEPITEEFEALHQEKEDLSLIHISEPTRPY